MLRIRKDQMAALAGALSESFAGRAITFLTANFPDQAADLTPDGVTALVGDGIPRAAAAGLDSERDVVRFLALGLIAGPNFAAAPWAVTALAGPAEGTLSRLYAQARRHGFTVGAALGGEKS